MSPALPSWVTWVRRGHSLPRQPSLHLQSETDVTSGQWQRPESMEVRQPTQCWVLLNTSSNNLRVGAPAGPGGGDCRLSSLSKLLPAGEALEKLSFSAPSSFCSFPSHLSPNPCSRPSARLLITERDVILLTGPILNLEEKSLSLAAISINYTLTSDH